MACLGDWAAASQGKSLECARARIAEKKALTQDLDPSAPKWHWQSPGNGFTLCIAFEEREGKERPIQRSVSGSERSSGGPNPEHPPAIPAPSPCSGFEAGIQPTRTQESIWFIGNDARKRMEKKNSAYGG